MKAVKRFLHGNAFFAWMLLLPSTLILVLIRVWPMIQGIQISFTNQTMFKDRPQRFVGLGNFEQLIGDSEFWNAFLFTLLYTVGTVVLSYMIGMVIALLMNLQIKGRSVFRMLLMIPWVIPTVVAAYIWRYALNDQSGIITQMLNALHIVDGPVGFLANGFTAQLVVTIISAWKNYPFMGLVLLAGFQNVSEDIKDAARIDGANGWQTFLHVSLPQLKGVTIMSTTLVFIWTFNNFDSIFLLTGGGPGYSTQTVSVLAYYSAFSRMNMGYASAISTAMLIFMTIFTVFYIRLVNGRKDGD